MEASGASEAFQAGAGERGTQADKSDKAGR